MAQPRDIEVVIDDMVDHAINADVVWTIIIDDLRPLRVARIDIRDALDH
jgi:hypothetical protein